MRFSALVSEGATYASHVGVWIEREVLPDRVFDRLAYVALQGTPP